VPKDLQVREVKHLVAGLAVIVASLLLLATTRLLNLCFP
jgi:hypothetical protein